MDIDLLRTALFTPGPEGRWGLPLLLTGLPGIGKSAIIRQTAKKFGLQCYVVLSSIREPSDFVGLPVLDGQGGVKYAAPGWALDAAISEQSVVFMDELNAAPPATQSATLRVIQEGVVGDLELPPGVRFLAAMNPTEIAANGWDLSAPMANRFGHLPWNKPSVSAWSEWLTGCDRPDQSVRNATDLETEVMMAWPAEWARARGLVTGFLQKKPDLLHKMPDDTSQRAKAWPSPRSWELACRAYAGSQIHKTDANALVAAFVGAGPAGEFGSWVATADLPDPAKLLDGEITWEPRSSRLDITMAVLSACTSLVVELEKTHPKRSSRATGLWKLLHRVYQSTPDLTVIPTQTLAGAGLYQTGIATEVMKQIRPLLEAAGFRS